ncbi:MAG: hypothetical protein ABS939_03820 [Psychrobacillus sp.]
MKKLLVLLILLTAVSLLAGCGKGSGESTAIESTISSIIKEEFKVYEDEGIFLVKIYDKDINEGSKDELLKNTGEMLAGLSKLDEVKSVEIKWYSPPFADQSDKEPFEEVLAVRFEAGTFVKVDWENYKTLDLKAIANKFKQTDTLKD